MMARLRAGDVRALARAVSMVEDGSPLAAELLAACEMRRDVRCGLG